MSKEITTAQQAIEYAFANYSGNTEREQHLQNIAWSVADQLTMVAAGIVEEVADLEAAARCVSRCVDQLRLALELDSEPKDDEAELAKRGWIRATEARRAVSILLKDIPMPEPTNVDNQIPAVAE